MGQYRGMIEATLFNLAFDMEHIGHGDDMREELRRMSDDDLIKVFNDFVEGMDA